MKHSPITKSITIRDQDSLNIYFNDIRKYKPLSEEEERALYPLIKDKDEKAIEKLILHNITFVISIAKQYQGQGLSLADLINEGNTGLVLSANKFDPDKGVKFISYAVWWIRQSIMDALSKKSRAVRVPISKLNKISKLHRASESFEKEFGREPSANELADITDDAIDDVSDILQSNVNMVYFDTPIGENSTTTLIDTIPNYDSSDFTMEHNDIKIEVQELLGNLPVREQAIMKMIFGIGVKEMEFEEIGEYFGLTAERIRQIKDNCLKNLKEIIEHDGGRVYSFEETFLY